MGTQCPECGSPAEITDRFTLASTAGGVEHVKLVCHNGHWLTPLAEDLEVDRIRPGATAHPARARVRRPQRCTPSPLDRPGHRSSSFGR
jgi:hypothetical protein